MNESVLDLRSVSSTNPNCDRPAGYFGTVVLNPVHDYYLESYTNIRASSANTLELIHDGFQSLSYWAGWELPPQYEGVALDTHIYQILSNAVSIFQSRIVNLIHDLLGRSAK